MFTGLIRTTGTITELISAGGGVRLSIQQSGLEDVRAGDSISVSGICLTVKRTSGSVLGFDVMEETVRRTTLARMKPGKRVNLEPALRVGDRLGGHFVLGHVDTVARVLKVTTEPTQKVVWISAPAEVAPYLVPKGSIAVDGVSLTVARLEAERFAVALVEYTLTHTTLGGLRVGDSVNLEADILAKMVVHYLENRPQAKKTSEGITKEFLAQEGFL
jgi:riboflavin synthase